MHARVVPLRRQGVELSKEERRTYQPHRGDVRVMCVMDRRLGRATNVAELHPGNKRDFSQLPTLYDAKLTGMSTTGYVLSGIEFIDGCAYAQSWWCRLA